MLEAAQEASRLSFFRLPQFPQQFRHLSQHAPTSPNKGCVNQSQRRHFNRALDVLSVDGMPALARTANRMRIQLNTHHCPASRTSSDHSTDQFAYQLGIRPQTARKRI